MEVTKITRREAYKANTEKRMSTREQILKIMTVYDDTLWSASSLCLMLGMKDTSIRPRVCDLKAEGRIEAVGITNEYGIREATYRLRKDDEIA